MTAPSNLPFWQSKTLDQMTRQEWESLCDGCGRCCLQQLEDEETKTLVFTNVVCSLLDSQSCQCTAYSQRSKLVPSCMTMTPQNIAECAVFAPPTCAYRLLYHGQALPSWHPLVTGDKNSTDAAGMSVRGKTVDASNVTDDELEEYIVAWPAEDKQEF